MMKNIFFCAICLFLFASCEADKPKLDAADTTAVQKPKTVEEVREELKSASVEPSNIIARVTRGMDKLMEEYQIAAETIDGFDNPSYTIDE